MKQKTSLIIVSAILVFAILVNINLASAEFWACFGQGEQVNFCNPSIPDRTCGTTLCKYCMKTFNEENQCYSSGNFNICNTLGGECGVFGGGNLDAEPPILTLSSPVENEIYKERKVLVDFEINEKATVYFMNSEDNGRWIKICDKCLDYFRERSFDEGLNNLTFRVVDVVGNENNFNLSFFVDSKDPRILKTDPRNGFASGNFNVQFKEENPTNLTLTYGNNISGYLSQELNLETECNENKGKIICNTDVNLDNYDGEEIEYQFILTDIAGNFDESKKRNLDVDTTFPILNELNYTIDRSRVNFFMNITEINFDQVEYIDNSDLRPRWKILCSRLKEGICEKKISLKTGGHDLSIQVIDDAGNGISQNVNLTIV